MGLALVFERHEFAHGGCVFPGVTGVEQRHQSFFITLELVQRGVHRQPLGRTGKDDFLAPSALVPVL